MTRLKLASAVGVATLAALSTNLANATLLDNDLNTTDVGYWQVDALKGGESRTAYMTAVGTPSGTQYDVAEVVFDYYSYVDVGNGGFRLGDLSGASPAGDDTATSSGSFIGSGGNTINWTVTSSIGSGVPGVYTNEIVFTAQTGTLGNIRFYQYLDEDVLGSSDDVFFTRGSTAGSDLELFTIDNAEAFGVSHAGALTSGQGLVNSSIEGWAACIYNLMKPAIAAGTQAVSPTGEICASLAGLLTNHPIVGPALGPTDVVSVVAWDVDSGASNATIISTLGGVPEAPPPASDFSKTIIDGPDLDGDGEIDVVIGVKQGATTAYQWKINYNQPELVLITDTAPAESVVTAVNDDGTGLPLGCGDATDFTDDSGYVEVYRGGKSGKNCRSATQFSWTPDTNNEMLVVDVQMRESPGKHKQPAYAPTSCGALYLNDGAKAYELDPTTGEPFTGQFGEWLPPIYESNQLCVAAVKDPTEFGPDADNDGDGIFDIDEACNNEVKTDPCLEDTDGDGIIDGLDSCPLEGPADTGAGETLGQDGCIISP